MDPRLIQGLIPRILAGRGLESAQTVILIPPWEQGGRIVQVDSMRLFLDSGLIMADWNADCQAISSS